MSALPGSPPRLRHPGHSPVRFVSEAFWTLIALLMGLVAFFVVAGGSALATGPILPVGLTLLALWGLHAWSIRRHVDDVLHDERGRRARERRGF
jgi:membrane protein implicated in regulation of membrane protease activity